MGDQARSRVLPRTTMANLGNEPFGNLGERLRRGRLRACVGRDAELDQFRAVLLAPHSCAVFFLSGPGGVGKSTLLQRFADEAEQAGRIVVEMDGHDAEAVPAAFEAAAAKVLTGDRVVLLVDSFEAYQPIEGWLRERFLPRLPVGSVAVFAGQRAPGVEWADPGWDDILRVMPLSDLPEEDALALLQARGVSAAHHAAVLDFAGGHPLALSLAAEAARRGDGGDTEWRPGPHVIGTLVGRIIGDVPSPDHQHALEICAHVEATTEGLLRAALPGADAGRLFAWLRELPFIDANRFGIRPHDVVREIVDADLRWRDPQRYTAMHRRVFGHLLEQARTASGPAVLESSAALLHLQRGAGFTHQRFTGKNRSQVFEDVFRPEDRQAVLELAAVRLDPASVALTAYWLDRQPEGFSIYREAGTGELTGFMAWLRFVQPSQEDMAADPVVAVAWDHVRRTAPLREKEHLGIARFMVSQDLGPSPTGDLVSARVLARLIHDDLLAWSCTVLPDPDPDPDPGPGRGRGRGRGPGERQTRSSCARTDPPPVAHVGDRTYGLFGQDWRAEPIEAWLERMDLVNSGQDQAGWTTARTTPTRRLKVLSRPEFDAAVRSALRSWNRPDVLSANPLVRTRLVADVAATDPVEAMRTAVSESIEKLGGDRGGEKLRRALTATFLNGTLTQEAAAERLGLPFSTYRRHLTRGFEQLCDLLWHRELRGAGPSVPRPRASSAQDAQGRVELSSDWSVG
ncbi:AAA family ATPase [Streptomyces sp. NPDC047108]|uniref:AAA family ATPase n=1 Tax=Streptomyces sp. NPDC047108 TaxID=3155025 RepID=UPI0033F51182